MIEQAADFRDESEALYALLRGVDEPTFERPTRFKQWTIADVLTHLHVWNQAALEALRDEAAFVAFHGALRAALEREPLRAVENRMVAPLAGRALLEAWRARVHEVADAYERADPRARIKWAGPDMSARTGITARLMETWAHGQAVYDVLGVERRDADRIRNIVQLGVSTFGWTFKTHGQPLPAVVPYVRLVAPSGAIWTYGEPSDTDRIEGSATEFCQVVTQTRNIADTSLTVRGDAATRWMAIAQCFAGPPQPPPAKGTRVREPVTASAARSS